MKERPLHIVQLSDAHLCQDLDATLLEVPTARSLQAVIQKIRQYDTKTDCLLLTGDLSQDGTERSYRHLQQMIDVLDTKAYVVPGNHDNVEQMEIFFQKGKILNDKHLVFHSWQIILLNSQKKGAVAGYLDDTQLWFLDESLKSHPECHAIVALHHHPHPVGSQWLDKIGLKNATDLEKILLKHPQNKVVLFGHVHQEFAAEKNQIQYLGVPSTCFQFKRRSLQFGLEKLNPGFRWLRLYDDGSVETGIVRTDEYIGKFDEEALGY